ncbi:AAA family ATPase [bacterium]|nr:AAA family ATPase [bacterium]
MILELVEQCSQGLVERRTLVEAIVLAAVAGEHVLVIGPPGTAKSEAARRVARGLGGRYFEYLLGKFSEPSELFGPVDLRKLKEGVLETATQGMLPEAEIAFLDEVFAGSTAILNSLLTLLNERVFRRGGTRLNCPLRVCIGASNALPEDESLAAFADRFLVRCFVEPVSDSLLESLLAGGRQAPAIQPCSLTDLDEVARRAKTVDLTPVVPLLANALRRLRREGLGLSDRRSVRVQNLIAAAAALAGRDQACPADLWPLVLAVPTASEQQMARQALHEVLAESDNPSLYRLAEEVSAGQKVRARRLIEAGQKLLAEHPDPLRVEGLLRDIDGHFAPDQLPPELTELRAQLKVRLP